MIGWALKIRLKKEFRGARFNFLDGIKVDIGKSWIHIRHSCTEPVIRIITEAKTKREAEDLYKLASSFLRRLNYFFTTLPLFQVSCLHIF